MNCTMFSVQCNSAHKVDASFHHQHAALSGCSKHNQGEPVATHECPVVANHVVLVRFQLLSTCLLGHIAFKVYIKCENYTLPSTSHLTEYVDCARVTLAATYNFV